MATEALLLDEVGLLERRRPALAPSRTRVDPRQRVEVGGVLIDQVDLTQAADRIQGFLRTGRPHQVMTVNLHFLYIADQDRQFRETINSADLAVPDGMPLVWLARRQGQRLPGRITGMELVEASCRLAIEQDRGVFLLGAAPGVADVAARTLVERYPGLRVAGVYSPPFGDLSAADNDRIIEVVRSARPSFLFVAMTTPRMDLWIRAHLEQLEVPVVIGVGCVLDVLAGVFSRAPVRLQRAGLEWAFRLAHEPGRLWRRYLLDDAPIFGRLLLESMLDGRRPVRTPL